VIVSLNSIVRVTVLSRKVETILSADGQMRAQLLAGDTIEIRRSERAVRLLRLAGSSFFETLRQKLHWSGSNV
jgi:NAD+ kinase